MLNYILPLPLYTENKWNKWNSLDFSIAYVRKLSVTNRPKFHLRNTDNLLNL